MRTTGKIFMPKALEPQVQEISKQQDSKQVLNLLKHCGGKGSRYKVPDALLNIDPGLHVLYLHAAQAGNLILRPQNQS